MKNINFNHFIGMRGIKTAIAVIIGLYISKALKLNTPIFTSITAITSMQPSISQSIKDLKMRSFTSVFGVILGTTFSLINVPSIFSPVMAGLGILIVVWVLVSIDMKSMITLSCIVFMASFVATTDKLVYGVNRIFGTLIGNIVGVSINYLISSPNVYEDFLKALFELYEQMRDSIIGITFSDKPYNLDDYKEKLYTLESKFEILEAEINAPFVEKYGIENPRELVHLFNEILIRLEILEEYHTNPRIEWNNLVEVERIFKITPFKHPSYKHHDDFEVVYNYHLKIILEFVKDINKIIREEKNQRMKYDR